MGAGVPTLQATYSGANAAAGWSSKETQRHWRYGWIYGLVLVRERACVGALWWQSGGALAVPSKAGKESMISRAVSLAEKGQYDDAVALCNQYLELYPGDQRGLRERGLIRLQSGDAALALVDFEVLAESGTKEPSDFFDLGRARLKGNDAEGAIDALTRAIILGEEAGNRYYESVCRFLRSYALIQVRRFAEAKKDLDAISADMKLPVPGVGLLSREQLLAKCR
jgi:tetratricopeptide (TPR) repeat protein